MQAIFVVLAFKIGSFFASLASTVGFLTFFFLEGLAPYRWHLIIGGTAVLVVCELASRFVLKRFIAKAEGDLAYEEA
jgi:hypothetical protein